jgi:fluoroquinolone resistance protein
MGCEIWPERAAVRPRVLPAGGAGGEPVLLEQLVANKLAQGAHGHLHLSGPTGSGRTTALRHLAQCFGPRDDLVLFDHSFGVEEIELVHHALLVSTGATSLPHGESWRMAPWSEDDRIEYLLARHRDVCGIVLARCQNTLAWVDLQGHAALWSACLDELAQDPDPSDVTTALTRILERALDAAPDHADLRAALLAGLWRADRKDRTVFPLAFVGGVELLRAALEIPSAALCLGAIVARRELLLSPPCLETWQRPWREQAVEAVASVFPLGEEALEQVEQATLHDHLAVRFKAMGVLHLLDPVRSARALLSPERSAAQRDWWGVGLPGIALPAARLREWKLQRCSLRGADLEGAWLDAVEANESDFSGARMQDSGWWTVSASSSDFAHSQAARAVFVHCKLQDSSWRHANLESSLWEEVDAPYSRFDAAKLIGAHLLDCRMFAAELGSVDLSRALFERCNLSSCDFRAARLEGTVFRHCRLMRTEWSGVVARGVELSTCNLKAAHLTDSVLTGSSLQGSSLVAAGLADASWVGCDLRDVDFTHASFHLGSTRSGVLVGAPPSWGTRTGFYPRDDGLDSSARPEKVRKADLRDCDLRGAQLDRCDFYLVDLRGALLSASQVDHLRRCKAILDREPRVE